MGVVTAVFGGMIRDILVNEIPWVVSSYQLYAVIAFAGGWLVWALGALGLDPVLAVSIGALVTIALRTLAIVFNWRLPAWRLGDGSSPAP